MALEKTGEISNEEGRSISLEPGDSAFVVRADGAPEIFIPVYDKPDDEVHPSAIAILMIATAIENEELLKAMQENLTKLKEAYGGIGGMVNANIH